MLNISEDFLSIQAEGISNGTPAYFIRLKKCNLMCGGSNGNLIKKGKATWWCDTEDIWRKGINRENEYLLNKWKNENILDDILNGTIHLVFTGGEPVMINNAKSIIDFLDYLHKNYDASSIYSEIETNGTLYIDSILFKYLNQINCSPKLANSGMKINLRIKTEAINRIMEHSNYQFKFVISSENDIKNIQNEFIIPFKIPKKNIILMPALDDQINFFNSTKMIYELGIKYHYKAVSRMHIAAWNKTTGV